MTLTRAETEFVARQIFAKRHTVRWEDSAPSSPARQEALREAREQLRQQSAPAWRDWKLCKRHTFSSNLQDMIDCPDCDTSSWEPTDSPSGLGD